MWMWDERILLNRPIMSKMTLLEYESGNPFIDFYGWYDCLPHRSCGHDPMDQIHDRLGSLSKKRLGSVCFAVSQ